MSIFKRLFAKQQGGSIVGNLLRTAGDAVTGGLYSKIVKAPTTPQAYDIEQAAKDQDAVNVALGKPNISSSFSVSPPALSNALDPNSDLPKSDSAKGNKFNSFLKKNWLYVVGGLASVGVLLFFVFRKKSRYGR